MYEEESKTSGRDFGEEGGGRWREVGRCSLTSYQELSIAVQQMVCIACMWDVPGRIAELQAIIDDPATSEAQKTNLQTVIKLYHDKVFPGPLKWIQDGKVVLLKDINFDRPYWSENGIAYISQPILIGLGTTGRVFPEMGSCERSHESGARVSAVAVCFEEWLSNQARPGQAKVQYNTYTQPHDPPLHAAATSGSALPDLTPWNPSSRWEKINQLWIKMRAESGISPLPAPPEDYGAA
ncbi:conserved hypothetical protein [Histoplasma capsulatum H143]|uniref:Uncharacterized protein n=1 Tax=Ajellomyces capsulatus (strain H143) TaxID=544712 RepID=C6HS42_AJECH|nr:conserved hypothetical protein [Histoplasma capsulatum H143]